MFSTATLRLGARGSKENRISAFAYSVFVQQSGPNSPRSQSSVSPAQAGGRFALGLQACTVTIVTALPMKAAMFI